MANELSKDEEAAFAAMQAAEQDQPEPEVEEAEAPSVDDEADETARTAVEGKGGKKPPPEFVPHAALHEERTRRQALETENRRLAEERARFDERLRVIQEMNQRQTAEAQQPQEDQPPAEDDYVGQIAYLRNKLAKLEQSGAQQSEEYQQAQRQQAQRQHLYGAAVEDAKAFRAKTADYGEAFEFWRENRAAELALHGVPQQQIAQAIDNEQLHIAASAFQRGVSPAETLYNIAKHRGFKAKPPAKEADDTIDRVATGQTRSTTLSGTGGGAETGEMTAAKLLAMSNEEFDAWTTKNPAKARRLMGDDSRRRT